MDMIGNAKDAELIHYWHHDIREDGEWETAPEGWEYLGEGCYRTAYLSPDGVVYKVQQTEGYSWQSNNGEWEQWKRLFLNCRMPKHTRLPWMYFHALTGRGDLGVIATERFNRSLGSCSRYDYKQKGDLDYWSLLEEVRYATGLGDLFGDNLMIDEENKMLVPTDLGYPSNDGW
jgi:hypothetical protein